MLLNDVYSNKGNVKIKLLHISSYKKIEDIDKESYLDSSDLVISKFLVLDALQVSFKKLIS